MKKQRNTWKKVISHLVPCFQKYRQPFSSDHTSGEIQRRYPGQNRNKIPSVKQNTSLTKHILLSKFLPYYLRTPRCMILLTFIIRRGVFIIHHLHSTYTTYSSEKVIPSKYPPHGHSLHHNRWCFFCLTPST